MEAEPRCMRIRAQVRVQGPRDAWGGGMRRDSRGVDGVTPGRNVSQEPSGPGMRRTMWSTVTVQ